jgi:hypothetical protein
VTLAWQLLFFAIAREPVRLRPVIPFAVLEKLSFGIGAIVLYSQGRLDQNDVWFGGIDLVLAVLFFQLAAAGAGDRASPLTLTNRVAKLPLHHRRRTDELPERRIVKVLLRLSAQWRVRRHSRNVQFSATAIR